MELMLHYSVLFFFFNDTATTEIYTLSLHDALPICLSPFLVQLDIPVATQFVPAQPLLPSGEYRMPPEEAEDYYYQDEDRKSTRLNSSHLVISYAVFCLKKKKAAFPTYSDDNYGTQY